MCIRDSFCIEYHYVDVFSTCKYVINTTESDIVSPSVTTEDPLGFLGQIILCLLYTSYAPCINHGIKKGMAKAQTEEELAVK